MTRTCWLVAVLLSLAMSEVVVRVAVKTTPATVAWKVPAYAWGRPAVDGDSVFFLSNQHDVTAVNAANGAVRWSRKTGEPDAVIGAGVTVVSGVVIAGDYNVTAFDRATGNLRWRFVPTLGFAPGVYLGGAQSGVLFAGSGSGHVYAIDVLSGAARWSTSIISGVPSITYAPVPAGDIVVATFTKNNAPTTGGVVALDAATGVERWRTMFPVTEAATASFVGTGASGSAVVVDNLVIASNRDGIVYALRRSDGSTAWTLPALSGPVTGLPIQGSVRADARALVRSGRTLMVGSLSGTVIAYDLDSRKEKWRYLSPVGSIAPELTADAQYVFVPTWTGRLASLSVATGAEVWWIGDYKNNFIPPPASGPAHVYASSSTGLHAIRR